MSTLTTEDVPLFEFTDTLPVVDLTGWRHNILAEQEQAGTYAGMIALHDRQAQASARAEDDVRAGRCRMPDGVELWDLRRRARAWAPDACGPKELQRTDRHEHWPAILTADLRCDHARGCECVGDLLHRAGCVVCGWVGPGHASENAAVEDYHDHAFGRRWRIAPVMTRSWSGEKKDTAWIETATRLYGQDWLDRGGPVWTARGTYGTRHVANRTPWGGYDLGVAVAAHWRAPDHRRAPLEFDPAMVTEEMR